VLMEQLTPPALMETNLFALMEPFFRNQLVMMEIDQFVLTAPLLRNLGEPIVMMGVNQPVLMGTALCVLMELRLRPVRMEVDRLAWMKASPCALMVQALSDGEG